MTTMPEPPHNTKLNDTALTENIFTPTAVRLLVLNFVLLLLIIAGLLAVFAGLGRGFWTQIGQVFF